MTTLAALLPTPKAASRARPQPALLTPQQIATLGVLLVAAQLPQAPHLPIWIALCGLALTGLRFVLLRRPLAQSARIPSWALAVVALAMALAIRKSYGYFIGRDPCVAFLFVLVGIKYLEIRTLRDGSVLVCLAVFLLITPFFYNQSMLAGIAAIPAVLAAGAALEALARTGSAPAAASTWRGAWGRTAMMIAQGLPIAAALFLLFPRLASPLWGLPADHTATTGLSERMAPGMISELSLSDAVAFRVDFDGPPPPPRLRYWRGPVLSRFDGREWRALSPLPGGQLAKGDGPVVRYTVTLEPNDHPWLFALDFPSALPEIDPDQGTRGTGFAGYSREQQLIMRAPVTQPLRYALRSTLRDSYPAASARDAQINSRPPAGNPRTVDFARSLREKYPDERRFISAVLQWFHNEPFFYTLAPPLLDEGEPVDMFLFDTRRGFCEHYASAFVVMLRAAGIPARVVTGYQGGEINPRGGYMIVRQSDAHAWAEAIVDGQWQRFDPTAAVAPSRIERGLFGSVPAGDPVPLFARTDGGLLKGLQLAIDAFNHHWQRNVVQFNRDRQRALWRDWKLDRFEPWQVFVCAMAAVLLWAAGVFAWFAARRKRQERALTMWNDVCRRLARAGLPRQSYEGPIAFAERAARRWPQFDIAFRAIGDSFAMLRYGTAASRDRERLALLATLERAIEVLPGPGALRAMQNLERQDL
jgi:transglutaminase-like putative cysteine protease